VIQGYVYMCIFSTLIRLFLRFGGTCIRMEMEREREREGERDETGQDLRFFG